MIPFDATPREIVLLSQATQQVLERSFEIAGTTVFVSASVGVAIAPTDGGDGETPIANGDLALYKAKRMGRGTSALFDNTLRADARARKELDTRRRQAYLNGELELHFQAQVRLADTAIVGSEALLRRNQGERWSAPGPSSTRLRQAPSHVRSVAGSSTRPARPQWPGEVRACGRAGSLSTCFRSSFMTPRSSLADYSITSLARKRSKVGTSRPKAFAVYAAKAVQVLAVPAARSWSL